MLDVAINLWAVLADMAPYLLLGFVVAGLLSTYFKPTWIERHLGRRGMGSVFKAAAFGVPLPLCSCGVIPVGTGLYRHGASKGATTAFMLSTPQTGVDSILATYGLLGPAFAVVRPVLALLNGFLAGIVVDRISQHEPTALAPKTVPLTTMQNTPSDASCSAGGACCDSQTPTTTSGTSPGVLRRLASALRYGLITLPADIAWALVVGLVIAAVLTALVPADAVTAYLGGGFLAMLAAVLIGVPLYVCSTGAIPIALGLMHVGASPGAALAFMVAAPATSAATLSVVYRVLGTRTTAVYLTSVLLTSIGAGLAFDALQPWLGWAMPTFDTHLHMHGLTWLDHAWALALVLLVSAAMWTRYRPAPAANTTTDTHTGDTPMQQHDDNLTLTITGMSCSHCVNAVTRALQESPRVSGVSVDLKTGLARVHGADLNADALRETLTGMGYDVTVNR